MPQPCVRTPERGTAINRPGPLPARSWYALAGSGHPASAAQRRQGRRGGVIADQNCPVGGLGPRTNSVRKRPTRNGFRGVSRGNAAAAVARIVPESPRAPKHLSSSGLIFRGLDHVLELDVDVTLLVEHHRRAEALSGRLDLRVVPFYVESVAGPVLATAGMSDRRGGEVERLGTPF